MSGTKASSPASLYRDDKHQRLLIEKLLISPACPPYTMNIDQLDGYLHSVAAEPKATNPEDWIPLVFGGELPKAIGDYSAEFITNALIWLYNSHRAQVLSNKCEFLFTCEYSFKRDERVRLEQWARGFMQGYIFWQDVWDQFLDEKQTSSNLADILPTMVNDEIDDILATLSAVADADYAIQTGVKIEDLPLIFNRLPEKVIEYGQIAHIIRIKGSFAAKACERAATDITN